VVLVDSSVYIHLLRAGADPVTALAEHFEATELVSCDIVRCEVLRGIIRPKARADLATFFDLLVHVTMDHRAWQETEHLAWQLDRAGRILPLTDVIIAVCALRANAAVLTRDQHFKMIPQLQLAKW
jgi:predicted nucleic acid-binding protein